MGRVVDHSGIRNCQYPHSGIGDCQNLGQYPHSGIGDCQNRRSVLVSIVLEPSLETSPCIDPRPHDCLSPHLSTPEGLARATFGRSSRSFGGGRSV